MMVTLWQDVRYALRMLRKSPGFTVVAILTLGLGIGANTAIFSVVNGVLLRPLPYKDPDRLIRVRELTPSKKIEGVSLPNFWDWRDQNRTFAHISAYSTHGLILTGRDEAERIMAGTVSANLFSLLGVQPVLGRTFRPEEEKPGENSVVVLSHDFWQSHFGSDPNINGKKLTLQGTHRSVVGVMPPGFRFPLQVQVDVWVPLAVDPSLPDRGAHEWNVIARLRPDSDLVQAQAEMDTIATRLQRQYPNTSSGWGMKVIPRHEQEVGDLRLALSILFGAVGFVLLIACANVANLTLARASTRQREMAVRTALGASRARILRQLLTESILLSGAGAGVGLLLAHWGMEALAAGIHTSLPRAMEIQMDARALGFALAISLLSGAIFGLMPALEASRIDLNESLKEGGRSSTDGKRSKHLRSVLVVSELALALVLLIGAGLMIRSFQRLQEVDPGFNPANLLTMHTNLPSSKYPEPHQRAGFQEGVLQRVKALPGVRSAAATSHLPVGGDTFIISIAIEGQPPVTPAEGPTAQWQAISSDYFRTMGILLLRGRDFTEQDREGRPEAVIINDTMARRFWPGEDPIGKRITISDGPKRWREIVGVVGNVKHEGLEREVRPAAYVPYLQRPSSNITLVMRTSSEPESLSLAVRTEFRAVDKDQPVYRTRTMEQLIAQSVSRRSFLTLLIGVFSSVAVVLATIGVYGVLSYLSVLRTHEIGIRMALGAHGTEILMLVLRQGMILILIGVGIGLTAAFALTRLMSSLLFSVRARDPATFVAVSLFMAAVALAACYLPARRAANVDPMVALRHE